MKAADKARDERTPRSVIAEVINEIYGQDGYDVAGLIIDALTDDDVRYLCRARMIALAEDD